VFWIATKKSLKYTSKSTSKQTKATPKQTKYLHYVTERYIFTYNPVVLIEAPIL